MKSENILSLLVALEIWNQSFILCIYGFITRNDTLLEVLAIKPTQLLLTLWLLIGLSSTVGCLLVLFKRLCSNIFFKDISCFNYVPLLIEG